MPRIVDFSKMTTIKVTRRDKPSALVMSLACHDGRHFSIPTMENVGLHAMQVGNKNLSHPDDTGQADQATVHEGLARPTASGARSKGRFCRLARQDQGFRAHCKLLFEPEGKSPPAAPDRRIVTSYPEPGVIRFYCGSNTKAWSDQVIAKPKFRPETNV